MLWRCLLPLQPFAWASASRRMFSIHLLLLQEAARGLCLRGSRYDSRQRPFSYLRSNNTYGWQRAELMGALINSVFLLAMCLSIGIEAIQRFFDSELQACLVACDCCERRGLEGVF